MSHTNWDSIIDRLQAGLVWFVIGVVVTCTCALILFDVLVGAGTMYFLTQKNVAASVAISLATTGLLMALMFVGYQLSNKSSQTVKKMGYGIAIAAFLVFCLDVYFDSLTADILRFGQIIQTHEVVHNLFRALLGGISTIGEAMAIAIIVGMPVLKVIINNAIPESYRRYHPAQRPAAQRYEQSVRTVPDAIRNQHQTTRPAPKPRPEPIVYDEPTYHPVGMTRKEREQ